MTAASKVSREAWKSRSRTRGRGGGWSRWRFAAIGWWLGITLCLGAFAALIWLWRYTPQRTPVRMLAAAPYRWPLPPNAWAAEDAGQLAVLDGQTISLGDADSPVFDADSFRRRFRRALEGTVQEDPRCPRVIWVSMHGRCDAATGTPYLVPPDASPVDPEQWVRVDTLLQMIRARRGVSPVLLVLDCQRMASNWNVGLTANGFVAGVERLYQQLGDRSLAVLMPCRDGQRACASPRLRSSVFGHYLTRGLAGAADVDASTGDGDGWVSLAELDRYLQRSVDHWSRHHRGTPQLPALLHQTGRWRSVKLARALRRGSLQAWIRRQSKRPVPQPSLAPQRLDGLWQRLDHFKRQRLYEREPIAFRDLEQRLLWLEQLATAGTRYQELAETTYRTTRRWLHAAEARLADAGAHGSFEQTHTILSGRGPTIPAGVRAHQLPLARWLATETLTRQCALEESRRLLAEDLNPDSLRDTLQEFEATSRVELASGRFLRMIDRYQTPGLWQRADLAARLLELQGKMARGGVPMAGGEAACDPRSHAWVRVMLSAIAPQRRSAEDCLFLRDCGDLETQLDGLETRWSELSQTVGALAQSRRRCDRALQQLPSLAWWVAQGGDGVRSVDWVADDPVAKLIEDTWQLAERLDQIPDAAQGLAGVQAEIQSLAQFAAERVERPRRALAERLTDACDQTLRAAAGGDGSVLRRCQQLLSLPLLSWQQRSRLRTARAELTERLAQQFRDALGGDAEPSGSDSVADAAPPQHSGGERGAAYLDALLGGQAGDEPTGSNRIQRFWSQIQRQAGRADQANRLAEQTRELRGLTRRLRMAASLWFPAAATGMIEQHQQVELCNLLLWHARESLADFWGPAGQRRAFFDLAASDYRNAVVDWHAVSIGGGRAKHSPVEIAELDRQLTAARQRARAWLELGVESAVQLTPASGAETSLSIQSPVSESAADVPSGTVALRVQQDRAPVLAATMSPSDHLVLPVIGDTRHVALPPSVLERAESLQVTAIFRGHEVTQALVVQPLRGQVATSTFARVETGEITVSSDRPPLTVALVIDASASMAEPLSGSGAGASKMDVAKRVLRKCLLKLADRGDVTLAACAFGHRVGWSTEAPLRPVSRPGLDASVVTGIEPSEDVEMLAEFGRLTPPHARRVIAKIERLKPWGQSPLYLALTQTLQRLPSPSQPGNTHVIVVTDGANYQFIPEGMTSKRSTTIADVRQILSTTTVPVHLFGLGTRQSENGPAMQPLRELARETGGRSLSFSGPADLKRALASLLDPGTFHVRPAGDASAATRSASLGNTVRLRPSPGGSQPVSIRVEGDPAIESAFRIRAGESVQLSVDREHRVLVAPAYDHEVAARQALVRADGDATGMVVRVHRPTRFEDGRVSFPISWQQRAADQTPERWTKTNRPASIWVEVQPLDAEGQAVGDGFVFCDAAYRPHRPVPLVHLQATRWPVHSERARVRVYCRPSMTGTRDVDAVPLVGPSSSSSAPVPAAGGSPGLDRLLRLDQLSETAQRLDGGVTVSLHEDDQGQGQTAGGQRVRRLSLGLRLARASSESASPGSDPPRVGDFKLSLPSIPRSSLTRVVRRYDRGLGMAVHCFEWVDTGQSVPTVRVTDRATETASAWRMAAESVEVELRQADAFVRPVRELSAAGER